MSASDNLHPKQFRARFQVTKPGGAVAHEDIGISALSAGHAANEIHDRHIVVPGTLDIQEAREH